MLKSMEKQELLNKMILGKWPAICKRIKLHLLPNTNGSTNQMLKKKENKVLEKYIGLQVFVLIFVLFCLQTWSGKGFCKQENDVLLI